mmetsp:Transcript_15449/g.38467  ORF Transcript_15449/g.38467 Transcript_15449/m.38467 type:complete len:316 (-) Transcript_15449:2614-3561(-)
MSWHQIVSCADQVQKVSLNRASPLSVTSTTHRPAAPPPQPELCQATVLTSYVPTAAPAAAACTTAHYRPALAYRAYPAAFTASSTLCCAAGCSEPVWSSSAGPMSPASVPSSACAAALPSPLLSCSSENVAGSACLSTSADLAGHSATASACSRSTSSGLPRRWPLDTQCAKFCTSSEGSTHASSWSAAPTAATRTLSLAEPSAPASAGTSVLRPGDTRSCRHANRVPSTSHAATPTLALPSARRAVMPSSSCTMGPSGAPDSWPAVAMSCTALSPSSRSLKSLLVSPPSALVSASDAAGPKLPWRASMAACWAA